MNDENIIFIEKKISIKEVLTLYKRGKLTLLEDREVNGDLFKVFLIRKPCSLKKEIVNVSGRPRVYTLKDVNKKKFFIRKDLIKL